MSVAVGFGPGGTPVGLELLGAPFAEATLLKLAYGWEQFAHPRKAPFSTPALVNGKAPVPVMAEVSVPSVQAGGASARVKFTYDLVANTLHYDAAADVGKDSLLALTLQRGTAEKPGAIIANLVLEGQTSSIADLTLGAKDREDLAAGHLFVHLYTRGAPLGVGRAVVQFPAQVAQK